jgi:uncharacterized protein
MLLSKQWRGGDMPGKFEITKLHDGEFHFHFKAEDGAIMLTSQRYKEQSSARDGVASVKKNAHLGQRYQRKEAHNGEFMFNLRAGNHQVIGTSHMYHSVESREEGIEAIKRDAPDAEVVIVG